MENINTEQVLAKIKDTLDNFGQVYLACMAGAFIVFWIIGGFAMALAVICAFIVGGVSSTATDLTKVRAQLEREVREEKGKANDN